MFTGLVSAVGEVRSVTPRDGGLDLSILAPYERLEDGESIAVNGACLTVAGRGDGWFGVHVVGTTLERTRFGGLGAGQLVNLERAMLATDRLGGHWVQGHVDGIGEVTAVHPLADGRLLDLRVPDPVFRTSIPLGSITVDGVSLTVNAMPAGGIIQLSLVPYTLARTTLGLLTVGDRVHLETDVLGKYVRAYLDRRGD